MPGDGSVARRDLSIDARLHVARVEWGQYLLLVGSNLLSDYDHLRLHLRHQAENVTPLDEFPLPDPAPLQHLHDEHSERSRKNAPHFPLRGQ
jgi:hypothetical protein